MRLNARTVSRVSTGPASGRFSMTRERIRQIEARTQRKMKPPARARVLRSFLEDQVRPGG